MTIKLYKYHGDNRKIEKSLDLVQTISNATVVETMDIINPVIILEVDQTFASVISFNYIYIQDLKRYYYVNNIEIMSNGYIKIQCHVDVLKTYSNDILNSTQYVKRQQHKCTVQLADSEYNIKSNRNLTIKNFGDTIIQPNNDFILTTFGKDVWYYGRYWIYICQ